MDFMCNMFSQVVEIFIYLVLLKDIDGRSVDVGVEGSYIGLNYVESIVDGLEDEEDDEYVVCVLEVFIVGMVWFFNRSQNYVYKCNEYYVVCLFWISCEVGEQLVVEVQIVFDCYLFEVNLVRDGMYLGLEDDGLGGGDVESDVFVKLNDVVEWCLMKERDECVVNWEEDDVDIDVKDEG